MKRFLLIAVVLQLFSLSLFAQNTSNANELEIFKQKNLQVVDLVKNKNTAMPKN